MTWLGAPDCGFSARRAMARAARLRGVDFVDYTREPTPRLHVHLFGPTPHGLFASSFLIEGGRRVRDLRVTEILEFEPSGDTADTRYILGLDREGDFSEYVLRVVGEDGEPPDGFDPYYASAPFSFKLDCGAQGDCVDAGCASNTNDRSAEPALDYLAKDYTSFRRLLFDRLTLSMPDWSETHVPDIGVALVELMAYIGDQLSYHQDAVATEAYLHTARLRTSVRRHARLVDYRLHEGCNARAWVCLCSDQDLTWPTSDVVFVTRVKTLPEGLVTEDALAAVEEGYEVFLPLTLDSELRVRRALGRIRIYTWGGEECCLPRGATRATLLIEEEVEPTLLLKAGDVIVFEEVLGPATGLPQHADPQHRHAVRLVAVKRVEDPLAGESGTQRLYEVSWGAEDSLPFPLCLSSLDAAHGCAPIHDVSVARGNVVMVDHGRREEAELGSVQAAPAVARCEKLGRSALTDLIAKPFRPALPKSPITHAVMLAPRLRFDDAGRPRTEPLPASASLTQDPRQALPAVELWSELDGAVDGNPLEWFPRFDLLGSDAMEPHFVVEPDGRGHAQLRFGDGLSGRLPEAGARFRARFRVGSGAAGNVPAEAIAHVVVRGEMAGGVRVRNPLPAQGGEAPEPIDQARELAPFALRARRERAIIGDDYAELALREHPELARAAGALRWTGSWYEALVALDARGSAEVPRALVFAVEHSLERYRRAGHDLHVAPGQTVPLKLVLGVCAAPDYLREGVRDAVRNALISSGGGTGLFDPDRLSFGQSIALSRVVAVVKAVSGVLDVHVLRFERLFDGDHGELDAGELRFGALEIPRLDADPSLVEHGVLRIDVRGGR